MPNYSMDNFTSRRGAKEMLFLVKLKTVKKLKTFTLKGKASYYQGLFHIILEKYSGTVFKFLNFFMLKCFLMVEQ